MAAESWTFETDRGDDVVLTLFTHAGQPPSVLVSIRDADASPVPTAEFTLAEAGRFRDVLRRACELGVQAADRSMAHGSTRPARGGLGAPLGGSRAHGGLGGLS